jgi:hypothetical protein
MRESGILRWFRGKPGIPYVNPGLSSGLEEKISALLP